MDCRWVRGEKVMISIPGVNGDRDRLRLLREGAREDTLMSLYLIVELDPLMRTG